MIRGFTNLFAQIGLLSLYLLIVYLYYPSALRKAVPFPPSGETPQSKDRLANAVNLQAAAELEWSNKEEPGRARWEQKVFEKPKVQTAVQNTKVIIAGITRNDYQGIVYNMKQIEALGSAFADYRVMLVENDSSQTFLSALRLWERRNPRVRIFSKKFHLKKRPSLWFLGHMRNMIVDEIRKPEYADFTRVILMDIDQVKPWPVSQIVGSSALPWPDFGARCFNIHLEAPNLFAHRDVLALRSARHFPKYKKEEFDSVNLETLKAVYDQTRKWAEQKAVVQVDSCFGGMAAYTREVFLGCRYPDQGFTHPHDPVPFAQDCEHVKFNECIAEKLNRTVILDTTVEIPQTGGTRLLKLFFAFVHGFVPLLLASLATAAAFCLFNPPREPLCIHLQCAALAGAFSFILLDWLLPISVFLKQTLACGLPLAFSRFRKTWKEQLYVKVPSGFDLEVMG